MEEDNEHRKKMAFTSGTLCWHTYLHFIICIERHQNLVTKLESFVLVMLVNWVLKALKLSQSATTPISTILHTSLTKSSLPVKALDFWLRTFRFCARRDPRQIPFVEPLQTNDKWVVHKNFRINSELEWGTEISVLGAKNMSWENDGSSVLVPQESKLALENWPYSSLLLCKILSSSPQPMRSWVQSSEWASPFPQCATASVLSLDCDIWDGKRKKNWHVLSRCWGLLTWEGTGWRQQRKDGDQWNCM